MNDNQITVLYATEPFYIYFFIKLSSKMYILSGTSNYSELQTKPSKWPKSLILFIHFSIFFIIFFYSKKEEIEF
jgi:hypothetical protein